MKIITKGSDKQPIQVMDELTFICSCGCEYKASIKEGEAKLDSISPYPMLSTMPIVYVYSSVCPSCGALCLYRGEPINYCCCSPIDTFKRLDKNQPFFESTEKEQN